MSIEIHAREDWTANRITLHVFASGTPYTGAQIYVDLSPEQAERLASQLLEQVKRFRELDKGVERDLKPKFAPGTKVRHKASHHEGVVLDLKSDIPGYIVVRFPDAGCCSESPDGLEIIPERTVFHKGCRVRLKINHHVQGVTVNDVPLHAIGTPVLWDEPQDPGTPVMMNVADIEAVP